MKLQGTGVLKIIALLAINLIWFLLSKDTALDVITKNKMIAWLLPLIFVAIDVGVILAIIRLPIFMGESAALWYTFGGWFLIMTANASAIWWAISLKMLHSELSQIEMKTIAIITTALLLVVKAYISGEVLKELAP